MIVRQLKASEYDSLLNSLIENAHIEPLSASCTVRMVINNVEYSIKLQPEHHHKMAILQALRIERDISGPTYELITKGNLLSSLLEILIYQGVA